MHKLSKFQQNLITLLKYGAYLIIVLVPFYAFFTTWLGSNIGSLLLLRAWKELLLGILYLAALVLIMRDTQLRKTVFKDKLVWLTLLFAVWSIISALSMANDGDAVLLGLAIQLRPFLFFLTACTVVYYTKVSEASLTKLVTYPAIGVVAFGLLQMFVLPIDFLKHFGYQKNVTIPPFFTIDEQYDRIRIFSTLRGPNPLGVYLIAPLVLAGGRLKALVDKARSKRVGHRLLVTGGASLIVAVIYLLLSATVLYGSHSRSAWLGLIFAAAVYIWLAASKKWRLVLTAVACLGVIVGGAAAYQYRQTNFVQDVILHDNPEEGGEVSSNQGRIDAFKAARADIASSPAWGCGVGCAGPASFHNKNGAKIAENFYIQTVQELGIVGLILLGAIHIMVIVRLLAKQTNFSYLWLAVFVGISAASLLSHAWADDTIAYLWWGIAGLLLGFAPKLNKSAKD